MTLPMPLVALVALACFSAAGCVGSDVLNANQAGVWVKEPLVGPGDPAAVAEAHCARYGKTAVFDSEIVAGDGQFRPIHAFRCE